MSSATPSSTTAMMSSHLATRWEGRDACLMSSSAGLRKDREREPQSGYVVTVVTRADGDSRTNTVRMSVCLRVVSTPRVDGVV